VHSLKSGMWLGIFLLTYNNLINFLPSSLHARIYVWINLVVLCIVWLMGRRYLDLNHIDSGFTKKNLVKSLLFGLGITFVVILSFLFFLWFLPNLRLDLKAPRIDGISQELWWRIFVRIPLGTVLFEETLFRGIFYGYLIKKIRTLKTIVVTSLFFAFWHITPTFKVVSLNFQINLLALAIIFWLVGLLGAFIGGLIFALIRYRTNNIGGCLLAHCLINDLALMIIYWVWLNSG